MEGKTLEIYFDPHGFGTNYYPLNLGYDKSWSSVKSAKQWAKDKGYDKLIVDNQPKRTTKTYTFK